MPSTLMNRFRGELKKQKNNYLEAQIDIGYSTGMLPLDFKNGKKIVCEDEYNNEICTYHSVGLVGGSINFSLGKSGLFKTTLLMQMACFIVAPFEESYIAYVDVEGGTHHQRVRGLTGWNNRKISEKLIHYNVGITTESFYNIVMTHCLDKINAAKEDPDTFVYNTGVLDHFGQPVYRLYPTIIVLDSLALLMPAKFHGEKDLSSPTAPMAAAKANAAVFTAINQPLKESNTTLLIVNHIAGDIAMDAFAKPQAQFNYLGQGKKMPGGDRPGYLANNIFESRNGGQLKAIDKDGYGVDGLLVEKRFIKSRTNKAGQSVKLVVLQETGFNPVLTMHHIMAEHKLIKSAGSKGSCLPQLPELTFTKKTFLDKFTQYPELRLATKQLIMPILNGYVESSYDACEEVDEEALAQYLI